MFGQLAGTPAIFLFIVNGETRIDGGQGRRGSFRARHHVIYHAKGRGQFGAGVEGYQGRFRIGQQDEQMAGGGGRQFFDALNGAGAENFQMGDESGRRRTAAAHFCGEGAGLIDTDDFFAGIETQMAFSRRISEDAASTTRSEVTRVMQR